MDKRISEEIFSAAARSFRFRASGLLNSLVLITCSKRGFTIKTLAEKVGKTEEWLLDRLNAPVDLSLDDMATIAISCGHEIILTLEARDLEPAHPTQEPHP